MDNVEIVKDLRKWACILRDYHTGFNPEWRTMFTAANLIESLTAQLAESQRREKAAVEDILVAHDKGRCKVCKHMQNVEQCQKWPSRSCFEWRGVEGGGE